MMTNDDKIIISKDKVTIHDKVMGCDKDYLLTHWKTLTDKGVTIEPYIVLIECSIDGDHDHHNEVLPSDLFKPIIVVNT